MMQTYQNEELEVMRGLIAAEYPAHAAEYDAAVKKWQERGEPESGSPGPARVTPAPTAADPTSAAASPMQIDASGTAEGEKAPAADDAVAEPTRKWRFSEPQRESVWLLTQTEMAMVELKNEKA